MIRIGIKQLLLCGISLLLAGNTAAQNPCVTTRYGRLEGTDESGVKVFKGIPYAAPPIGELRWKAPQPVIPWDGIRRAVHFGPNPMQQPLFGDMNFGTKKMSEDCLYLNIWTPAKTMNEKLPVLIYFNGGGLLAGSGSEPRYAGLSMARDGIVAVTANYREGIFGFFAHPELSKETSYKGSGDYGFLDQVAAIRWVKENIAVFGGDPDRITVAGESAGSVSVSALMASPLCKGLFRQAIGSSGSVLGFTRANTLKAAETAGKARAEAMGCRNLAELRAMPAEELMEKAAVRTMNIYNIDNYFWTKQPADIYAAGQQMQIPLLVGGNTLEAGPWYVLAGQPATMAGIRAAAKRLFPHGSEQILNLYGFKNDADVSGAPGVAMGSDVFIAFSTWKWSEMQRSTGHNAVYRYLYTHPRPGLLLKGKKAGLAGGVQDANGETPQPQRDKGAVHSADIEYAMGNLSTNRIFDWQAEDYFVSDIFKGYYVNFIRTGNPNGIGLPEWTAANGTAVPPVLLIGTHTRLIVDEATEERYHAIDALLSPAM